MRQKDNRSALIYLIPLVFFTLFFFYPLTAILAGGITNAEGRFSLSRIFQMLSDPYYTKIIAFTLKQALLSTLLSLLLGLPGAYLLARTDFRGKNILKSFTTIPFVLPSILVVLGFVRFFGNNGVLNRALMGLFSLEEPPLKILYSLKAILLAHAFYNFPICIRIVGSVWSRINPHTEEAARSLGARGVRLFMRIGLPQILPGILASAALIFVFCFMSFAIIMVLGGGPRFTTLEVEVYRQAKISLDLNSASSLAIIGAVISLLMLYLYIKFQQKTSFAETFHTGLEKVKLSRIMSRYLGIPVILYLIFVILVIAAPMLSVIHYSFIQRSGWAGDTSFTFKWYGQVLLGVGGKNAFPYLRAILYSLFFGAMTVLFSLPLGTSFAFLTVRKDFIGKHGFESLLMLPLGVSAIILGLGYLKAFRSFPLPIHGHWYAIVLAHTIIATPFVIRSVTAVMRKISPTLKEAALCLGANPWQLFWRIELPMLRPGIITAAAFAFALSLGELTATLMLTRPDLITIPIAIYRLIGAYNFQAACAMGSLLMLTSFAAFFIIDRLGQEVF